MSRLRERGEQGRGGGGRSKEVKGRRGGGEGGIRVFMLHAWFQSLTVSKFPGLLGKSMRILNLWNLGFPCPERVLICRVY